MLDVIHVIRPASLVLMFGVPWLVIAVWYSRTQRLPHVVVYFLVTFVFVEALLIGARFLELALVDALLSSFAIDHDSVMGVSEKTVAYQSAVDFKNAAHGRNVATLAFAIIAPVYVLIIGLCGKLFFYINALD